mmetsp:Transcript_105473/g.335816  ORF Transcript_105473/g.335816 Transcript_105473/m.335816 type:complete len:229 (-) Transcript_105473:29-715(-)
MARTLQLLQQHSPGGQFSPPPRKGRRQSLGSLAHVVCDHHSNLLLCHLPEPNPQVCKRWDLVRRRLVCEPMLSIPVLALDTPVKRTNRPHAMRLFATQVWRSNAVFEPPRVSTEREGNGVQEQSTERRRASTFTQIVQQITDDRLQLKRIECPVHVHPFQQPHCSALRGRRCRSNLLEARCAEATFSVDEDRRQPCGQHCAATRIQHELGLATPRQTAHLNEAALGRA